MAKCIFSHIKNHAASKTQCKLGITKWKFRVTDTFFCKKKYWKKLNSQKWTPGKNWNFFDSWKLIHSEYNFLTHENKYFPKIVLLRQLDIFLWLKTLLQRDNIFSMFLSVWMGKRPWNQNTASNYTTNWNQICSWWGFKNQ